jgi:hypothetical protein
MAYSTNPFSVATFGESYEQANASFVLTGVVGTGAVGDPDISSRTNVDLTGVQGNGAAGSITVAAAADVAPTGVAGTGAAGAITADGGVGTTPTITMATAFTASLGGITVSAGFGPTIQPVGFGLQIITDSLLVEGDEVVVESDANISLAGKGVGGTTAVNTVTLDCKAVVLPVGVQGTFTVGDETINAIQFDYESIKENYSRDRTAYIGEYSTLGNTAYVRAA